MTIRNIVIILRVSENSTQAHVPVDFALFEGTMMRSMIFALAAILMAAPATAQTFTGTTSLSDPTFNRTLSGSPPDALSLVGTAVHYQALAFEVTADGDYDFLLEGTDPFHWDTFLGLYTGAFDPANGLQNILVANDDFPNIGFSGLTANLMAGTSYFAIVTGFGNEDVGAWTLDISGPGLAVPAGGAVPEPAAWAMLIGGLGFAGAAMRTRRRRLALA
ncbi:PEPxxWA-CTERM sorting domain-containing protein [Sphingomonas sp. RS6]